MKLRFRLRKSGGGRHLGEYRRKGIEEINRRLPNLVLVDYYLPGVRGDELCRPHSG